MRLPIRIDFRATVGLAIVAAWLSCGENQGSTAREAVPPLSSTLCHPALETLDFRAVALTWVDDRTVAVLDRDDQQIVYLDLDDGNERRAANKGGGPGELENALMLLGDGSGGLVVGDMKQNRVSQFDATLSFVRSAQVPGLPIAIVDWDGERVTAIWMQFEMGDPPSFVPTAGVVDLEAGEGRALYSLYSDAGLAQPETENPFSPPFISAVMDRSGRIVAGQSTEYRIVAFDDAGAVVESFGRSELGADYLSEEELAAERQRLADAGRGRGAPPPGMRQRMEDALEAPQPFFGPGAFTLDSAGRLWVITSRETDGSTEIDVFSRDGDFLGTVSIADRVRAMAFKGDQLAVLVDRMAEEVEGIGGIDMYEVEE